MGTQLQPVDILAPGQNLTAYIQVVNGFSILSAEEEKALAEDLYYRNNLDAARRLVMAHLRFVVHVAKSYSGYGLAQGDLIQEGNVGLMKAVKRFNPEKGVRLISCAVHWIKAEIHEFILRNWRIVKIATTKAQRKLFFNLRRMRPDGQTLDTAQVDAIARELDVRPQDVSEMEVRLSGHDMALEAPANDDDDNFAPISYLSDEGHEEPTRVLERRAQDMLEGSGLEEAIDTLDERSQRIARLAPDRASCRPSSSFPAAWTSRARPSGAAVPPDLRRRAQAAGGAGPMRLHHVQVACPRGGEDAARRFYGDALGIPEVAKPPVLAARGGCWFRGYGVEVHVGVEEPFVPARKAHPAFVVDDIDAVAARVASGGFEVTWDDDFPGFRRFYTADGAGNRVELLASL